MPTATKDTTPPAQPVEPQVPPTTESSVPPKTEPPVTEPKEEPVEEKIGEKVGNARRSFGKKVHSIVTNNKVRTTGHVINKVMEGTIKVGQFIIVVGVAVPAGKAAWKEVKDTRKPAQTETDTVVVDINDAPSAQANTA